MTAVNEGPPRPPKKTGRNRGPDKPDRIMRVLSGIQSSGKLHLGNYFSMMKRMIDYQEKAELYCFIASYHALTTVSDRQVMEGSILDAALDFLALGLDPERSVFWVQSDVPEVTELTWLLSTSITVSQLELAHSYKDKTAQGIVPSAGLMFYPVLMTADILAFQANKVPVGKDQKQHLEMARDIRERFNKTYGETFAEPEPDILGDVALVPGTDGRKMSKSYGNTINFFETEKKLRKQVMSIVTDSTPVEEPKEPAGALFDIYRLFLDEAGVKELEKRFRTPGEGYGHIKQSLYEAILEHFGPAREKRADLAKRPDDVRDMLAMGAKKARATARETLDRARENMGLVY